MIDELVLTERIETLRGHLYDLLCNYILWAKCRNNWKFQIGPMAIQTSLGHWKLLEKCIHIVRF